MVTPTQFNSPYYSLKTLIKKKGKTQADVAKEIGMDRTTFNLKINRNNGRDFTFQEAISIADVLKEKIELFF